MEGFDFMSNIVSVIVTAVVTWAGTFLFYRQKRDSLDIENEARRSEEWRKLYEKSQEDSRDKDRKIDELRHLLTDVQRQVIELERRVLLSRIYSCERMPCADRQQSAEQPLNYDREGKPGGWHNPSNHSNLLNPSTAPVSPGQPFLADTDDTDSSDDLDR